MDLLVKLILLLHLSIAVDVSVISEYKPVISKGMAGNITDKSFVLDMPNCLFNNFNQSNVWLVIALDKSYFNLTDFKTPVPYSTFKNGSSDYYHTLMVSAGKYPCNDSKYVIQVGSESSKSCSIKTYCNGFLSSNQTYRAKFVLLNSSEEFVATNWSLPVTLNADTPFPGNTVWPSGRSGGMIVLTSILSVLMAILLVLLIIALILGSQDICWKRKMVREKSLAKMDFMTKSTYRSRYDHMYEIS